jgi:RNA polymerase sigma factor
MLQLLLALEDVLAEEQPLPGSPPALGGLEQKICLIQAGDDDLRNEVITDCLPYIKGVLNRMLQIPQIEQTDEFSIALTAFNEAIDRYLCATHVPFLRFAGLVINRRIIDWLRQQKHHSQTRPLSHFEDEQGESALDRLMSSPGETVWQNMEVEEEIVLLLRRLQDYNLTLTRLLQVFPRHRDSRLLLLRAARLLLLDADLCQRFEGERRLPAAELSRRSMIPLKTIERNRPSIIFLALLLSSDLDVIKAYLMSYTKEASL